MSDPEILFVQDAFGLGVGDFEPNMILIRLPNGDYRRALGVDLAMLAERAPAFLNNVKRRHREESF